MAAKCDCTSCLQRALLPLLAITFTVWVVSLGGLGSLQYMCEEPIFDTGHLAGVRGFSAVSQTCSEVYGYYWWHVALEFTVLCGLALAAVGNAIAKTRGAWVGLVAAAATLYIQASDSFLAVSRVAHYSTDLQAHTARATAAGFIMTACLNLLLILVIGTDCDAESAACGSKYDADKKRAAAPANTAEAAATAGEQV